MDAVAVVGLQQTEKTPTASDLNGQQLPEYGQIPWSLPASEAQVAVIHTLCIHPQRAGQGLARRMVAFCEGEARRQGKTVMRLDTWEHNLPANRMYPALGYRYAPERSGPTRCVFLREAGPSARR